jgi:hypothetical protein
MATASACRPARDMSCKTNLNTIIDQFEHLAAWSPVKVPFFREIPNEILQIGVWALGLASSRNMRVKNALATGIAMRGPVEAGAQVVDKPSTRR